MRTLLGLTFCPNVCSCLGGAPPFGHLTPLFGTVCVHRRRDNSPLLLILPLLLLGVLLLPVRASASLESREPCTSRRALCLQHFPPSSTC